MTAAPGAGAGEQRALPWRAIAGVLLIAWAAFLGIGIAGPYVSGNGPLQCWCWSWRWAPRRSCRHAVLIASLTRADRDQAGSAWETSVSASPPTCTTRCCRRSRWCSARRTTRRGGAAGAPAGARAAGAWMRERRSCSPRRSGAALRDVVAEVRRAGMTIEHYHHRRPPDRTRRARRWRPRRAKALRNSARHAAGAAVSCRRDRPGRGSRVFVRERARVSCSTTCPASGRGLRDAVLGRMAAVGGSR